MVTPRNQPSRQMETDVFVADIKREDRARGDALAANLSGQIERGVDRAREDQRFEQTFALQQQAQAERSRFAAQELEIRRATANAEIVRNEAVAADVKMRRADLLERSRIQAEMNEHRLKIQGMEEQVQLAKIQRESLQLEFDQRKQGYEESQRGFDRTIRALDAIRGARSSMSPEGMDAESRKRLTEIDRLLTSMSHEVRGSLQGDERRGQRTRETIGDAPEGAYQTEDRPDTRAVMAMMAEVDEEALSNISGAPGAEKHLDGAADAIGEFLESSLPDELLADVPESARPQKRRDLVKHNVAFAMQRSEGDPAKFATSLSRALAMTPAILNARRAKRQTEEIVEAKREGRLREPNESDLAIAANVVAYYSRTGGTIRGRKPDTDLANRVLRGELLTAEQWARWTAIKREQMDRDDQAKR